MTDDGKIRVLIVDDSLFMRVAIKRVVEETGEFEVVGEAKDGKSAIEAVGRVQPNVVTMDVNMPNMDGVAAVREIMQKHPTPVVMLSAHTELGARSTIDALAAGAVDFMTKPDGEVSTDLSDLAEPLREKLRTASRAVVHARAPRRTEAPVATESPASSSFAPKTSRPPRDFPVVVIGVSTGGPEALNRIFPSFPPSAAMSIVVVQHMPEHFTGALAERLNSRSPIPVLEARNGDRLREGTALIAKGGRHLELSSTGIFRLTDGPEVNGCRPSVDVTMSSLAKYFGPRCIGVIMTGMGHDGAAGMAAIKAAGGMTLAQNEATSAIYGMPKAAIERGVVDEVVALDDIVPRLTRATRR